MKDFLSRSVTLSDELKSPSNAFFDVPSAVGYGLADIGSGYKTSGAALLLDIDHALAATGWNPNPFLVTNSHDSGNGSLRSAIEYANAIEGHNRIWFHRDLLGQDITLNSEIAITDDLTLGGLGRNHLTISGDGQNRIFNIDDGDANNFIEVDIKRVTIADGFAYDGGAIKNSENLTLRRVNFENNAADYVGGAILNNRGELTLKHVNISHTDETASGFVALYGGGIFNFNGAVTMRNTRISGLNVERCGGAIFNEAGYVSTLGRTRLNENEARHGGAILNLNGILHLAGTTTLYDNSARELGGGVSNFYVPDFAGAYGRTLEDPFISGDIRTTLIMQGHAMIRENRANDESGGGGLFDEGNNLIGVREGQNIVGNTPQDIVQVEPAVG